MPVPASDRRGRAADLLAVLLAGLGPFAYLTIALLSSAESYAMIGVLTAVYCFTPVGVLICLLCLLASKDRTLRRVSFCLLLANVAVVLVAFLRPAA